MMCFQTGDNENLQSVTKKYVLHHMECLQLQIIPAETPTNSLHPVTSSQRCICRCFTHLRMNEIDGNEMIPASTPNMKKLTAWLAAWWLHCVSQRVSLCIGIESVPLSCPVCPEYILKVKWGEQLSRARGRALSPRNVLLLHLRPFVWQCSRNVVWGGGPR